MLVATLLSAFALAGSTLADEKAIAGAISSARTQADALSNIILSWRGNPLGVLPISVQAALLYRELLEGTRVAYASEPLTMNESAQIGKATQDLAARVNVTLETLVAAKPKFDHLLLRPVIHLDLELHKDAANTFGASVAAKIPGDLQAVAKGFIQGIDYKFDEAIDAYRLLNI
ncbi:hydrophobic surface binding protein A domain-containing protein [Hirsutella rhossiliensis]|uniref:Hydrophobic surface binding protein A domain-containing protein n=1 Tax=Hirsutella rhossiliensis TaxID=111463 RepID=A0A9P8SHE6_9HYPO|nr:hydrophobic surface binding protein A domain-containing protein [Hirsutella rhossiliensis]KAH0961460.1 hydrophobic surface binding protein A domain-containing protein [Hirsutella rhossiliensis]